MIYTDRPQTEKGFHVQGLSCVNIVLCIGTFVGHLFNSEIDFALWNKE